MYDKKYFPAIFRQSQILDGVIAPLPWRRWYSVWYDARFVVIPALIVAVTLSITKTRGHTSKLAWVSRAFIVAVAIVRQLCAKLKYRDSLDRIQKQIYIDSFPADSRSLWKYLRSRELPNCQWRVLEYRRPTVSCWEASSREVSWTKIRSSRPRYDQIAEISEPHVFVSQRRDWWRDHKAQTPL